MWVEGDSDGSGCLVLDYSSRTRPLRIPAILNPCGPGLNPTTRRPINVEKEAKTSRNGVPSKAFLFPLWLSVSYPRYCGLLRRSTPLTLGLPLESFPRWPLRSGESSRVSIRSCLIAFYRRQIHLVTARTDAVFAGGKWLYPTVPRALSTLISPKTEDLQFSTRIQSGIVN